MRVFHFFKISIYSLIIFIVVFHFVLFRASLPDARNVDYFQLHPATFLQSFFINDEGRVEIYGAKFILGCVLAFLWGIIIPIRKSILYQRKVYARQRHTSHHVYYQSIHPNPTNEYVVTHE